MGLQVRSVVRCLIAGAVCVALACTAQAASADAERLAKARAQLTREIDAHPATPRAYHDLLERMAKADLLAAAPPYFEARLERGSDDALARFGLGHTLVGLATSQSAFERAREHLRGALEGFPDDVVVRRDLARACLALGDAADALGYLQPVLMGTAESAPPIDVETHRVAAEAYLRQRQFSRGEIHLRAAIDGGEDSADDRLALADLLRAAGRYDEAADELGIALRSRNRSPDIYYALGKVYAHQDMPEKAVDMYRRAARYDPDNASARYDLANIFLSVDNGQYTVLAARSALAVDGGHEYEVEALRSASILDAAETLERAAANMPDNAPLHAFLGKLQVRLGDSGAARRHFERAKELDPSDGHVRAALGRLLMQEAPAKAAEELKAAAADLDAAADPEVLAALAEVYKNEGNTAAYIETTAELATMTAGAPGREAAHGDALLEAAREASAAGDDELNNKHLVEAAAAYQRAADAVPMNPHWTFRLAKIYDELGMLKCVRLYREAANLDPDNAEIHYRWGVFIINFGMGKRGLVKLFGPEDAIRHLQQAVTLDPSHGGAHYALGLAHKRNGDDRLALKMLERAEQLDFMADEGMLFLAVKYAELGRHMDAVRMLDRALDLLPDDVEVLKDFGYLALRHGGPAHRPKALQSLRRVVELAPEDPEALMNYGFGLHDTGRSRQAVEVLSKAAGLDPKSDLIQYNLALALDGAGHRQEAVQAWRRLLRMAPDGPHAEAAQERIAYLAP